jgi:hypothetical protein
MPLQLVKCLGVKRSHAYDHATSDPQPQIRAIEQGGVGRERYATTARISLSTRWSRAEGGQFVRDDRLEARGGNSVARIWLSFPWNRFCA